MKDRDKEILERLLIQRAARLGTAHTERSRHTGALPRFLEAKGQTDTLGRDLTTLAHSEYPQPDCVMPYEVETLVRTGLSGTSPERRGHIEACTFCLTMISGIEPNITRAKEFLREVRAARQAGAVKGACMSVDRKSKIA